MQSVVAVVFISAVCSSCLHECIRAGGTADGIWKVASWPELTRTVLDVLRYGWSVVDSCCSSERWCLEMEKRKWCCWLCGQGAERSDCG